MTVKEFLRTLPPMGQTIEIASYKMFEKLIGYTGSGGLDGVYLEEELKNLFNVKFKNVYYDWWYQHVISQIGDKEVVYHNIYFNNVNIYINVEEYYKIN